MASVKRITMEEFAQMAPNHPFASSQITFGAKRPSSSNDISTPPNQPNPQADLADPESSSQSDPEPMMKGAREAYEQALTEHGNKILQQLSADTTPKNNGKA